MGGNCAPRAGGQLRSAALPSAGPSLVFCIQFRREKGAAHSLTLLHKNTGGGQGRDSMEQNLAVGTASIKESSTVSRKQGPGAPAILAYFCFRWAVRTPLTVPCIATKATSLKIRGHISDNLVGSKRDKSTRSFDATTFGISETSSTALLFRPPPPPCRGAPGW